MSSRRLVILIFKALVPATPRRLSGLSFATRPPLAPNPLFTFDDVNLAYSIGHSPGRKRVHFDIHASGSQIPGEYELAW
jgi:hypothetical protein